MKTDGRHIDRKLATLSGEGAQQHHSHTVPALQGQADGETYYGLPVLKPPVWGNSIPLYLYVGGASGAAALLAATAELSGRPDLRRLVSRLRWMTVGGAAASAALLIEDLGKPIRFLYMLRVFRPTSPMSIGSWVLTVLGGAATVAALLTRAAAPFRLMGDLAGRVAGLLGPILSGYTAVLLSTTAVPLWNQTGLAMPLYFMGGSMASVQALLGLLSLPPAEERVLTLYGRTGVALELLAGVAVERAAGALTPRVARPLQEGLSGDLRGASRWLAVSSLTLGLCGRSRRTRWLAAVLGTGAAVAGRFAVFYAGKASARDPRATFESQRAMQARLTAPREGNSPRLT